MKKLSILFLTITSCFLINQAKGKSSSKLPVPKNDSLTLKAIPHPLMWIDKPKNYTITSGSSISVVAEKGTDLYTFVDGNHYTNNAPKLLFKPDSDFIFSAKIKTPFNNVYDGGAILIYSDGENWSKLLFERLDKDNIIIGSSVIKDKKTDDSYNAVINKNEVYLKVAKSGKIFCYYYSLDGKNWKLLRTFAYDKAANMKLGFYAQSPNGPSATVEISDISYKGEGFKNFFTGE